MRADQGTFGLCVTYTDSSAYLEESGYSMKKLLALRKTLLLVPLLSVLAARVDAQSPQSRTPPDELFRTVASLDGALFEAFNRCDREKPVGEGSFVHVCQNKDGAWKITRVLSYDHHAVPK